MNKMNKVVEFVENHKNKIATAAVVTVVGAVGGFIGYKMGAKNTKKYGELIKAVQWFNNEPSTGRSLQDSLVRFLDVSTRGVYPVTPKCDMTLGDMLSEEIIDILGDYGFDSNTKASGVVVGVKV